MNSEISMCYTVNIHKVIVYQDVLFIADVFILTNDAHLCFRLL